MALHTYLPQDRLRALARGEVLPDRADGSALFADISGFTPLTEALRDLLGARRGAEEMTRHLGEVYTALVAEVERYGGSVIDFAGDSVLCWFDATQGQAAARAVNCAIALQQAILSFSSIPLPEEKTISIAVKVAVATGPARRLIVGDPGINCIDVLAGATVSRTSTGEQIAQKGEVIVDRATVDALGSDLSISEWRADYAVLKAFNGKVDFPVPAEAVVPPAENELKAWLNHAAYERERSGQDALMTEFRPCVAMFVRFVGIDYDSDEAGGQLHTFIQWTQNKAEELGGTLLQVTIGDKGSYVYINFGALSMHEDDSRRAVHLALALREAARSFGFLSPLQIGITQGTMFVGRHGGPTRKWFGALGDDVNLVARLMMTAAPGEILISGHVRKAVMDEFTLESRPVMGIRGKAEPLPTFLVLGVHQQRSVRLQEPAYLLPMIGRERELEFLSQKISLVSRGRGQILLISGEAGMGKSRMAAEGIRLAHRGKLIGYGGVCKSDGVNSPYLVWNAIWSAFFDIDPALPLRKQIRTLEDELADRAPEYLDAMPLLGVLLGLPLPENDFTRALQPKDRKNQMEALLLKCLESAVRESAEEHGGLFFVLEDLHWSDPVSLDLLELIARAIADLPVLLLLTHRPADLETLAAPLGRIQALDYFAEIRLTDLNLAESEQIIRAKLVQLFPGQRGDASRHLIERIATRAQGNPFYLEELLNYLHDRGVDPRNEAELSSFELPSSLHSLILSRIDQLTPPQQFLLKVASIMGRVFGFEDLSRYYPWRRESGRLREDLQAIIRADLISMESLEPVMNCLFRHLVIHEVGYESIAFTTRVQWHGLYAHYLEKTYPERIHQIAPQLAHHFEMAQSRDKAVTYLATSGEQAAAHYANDEALAYFTRALKLLSDENSRTYFDILWKRERVYDLLGQRTEQRQDLAILFRLADPFEDASSLRTQLFIRQARMEIDLGDYAAAKENTRFAIRELTEHPHTIEESPDLLVDTLLLEARTMFLTGEALAARPQLDEALKLARTYQYVRGEYNALANLGLWHWYKSENIAAADHLKQSLELIRRAGDVRREVEILNNLGIVTKDMYQFNEAIAHYETAQRIAKKIGDRSNEASLLTNMGRASLVSCHYMEAEAYCARAAALAAEVNEATVQSLALHNRSEALRELGQFDLARSAAEESLKLVRASGYKVGEANTLENMALIEMAQGDHVGALMDAGKALAITREIASRRVEASVLTRIGYIHLELGQLNEAESSLNEARIIAQEVDEPILRLEIQAGLARVALAREGSADLDSARTLSQALMDELLQEPPTEQSHILPLGLFLVTIRVLFAAGDPAASKLIARANSELGARSGRISNGVFHASYVDLPEHRDILALANGDIRS